jgi:hypothetical protein
MYFRSVIAFKIYFVVMWGIWLIQNMNDIEKAPNNIVFVHKSHYIDCVIKELGYWQFTWQPYTYPDDTYERGNPGQS